MRTESIMAATKTHNDGGGDKRNYTACCYLF